jgi:hypothetical protein
MRRTFLYTVAAVLFWLLSTSSAFGQQRLNAFPHYYMPEAWDGFRSPVDYTPTTCDACGNRWLEQWTYSCGTVFHPGWDLNAEKGLDDGKPVYAIGTGRIVWIGRNNQDWMGIIVEHLYLGAIFYSGYGHVKNIKPDLVIGQVVKKGQQLAEVGSVGTNSPHLHFELRSSNHPNPTFGTFFCEYALLNGRNTSIRESATAAYWYLDPRTFVNNPAYFSSYTPSKPFVAVKINPSEVRAQNGRYYFAIELEEVHGMQTRITNLWIGRTDYSAYLSQWLGNTLMQAYNTRRIDLALTGSLSADLLLSFTVAGFDANFNAWFLSDGLSNFKAN